MQSEYIEVYYRIAVLCTLLAAREDRLNVLVGGSKIAEALSDKLCRDLPTADGPCHHIAPRVFVTGRRFKSSWLSNHCHHCHCTVCIRKYSI